MTDLRTKAAKCEFQAHESDIIRDKIVFGVHDTRIKDMMLRRALARALDDIRKVRAETTSQSFVEVADLESMEGSLCIQSIAMTQADFSSVR